MRGGGRKRGSEDVWNGHGGYMGIKKAKLLGQFSDQAQFVEKEAGIFTGKTGDSLLYNNRNTNLNGMKRKKYFFLVSNMAHC